MKKVIPNRALLIPENATKTYSGVIFDVYRWQQELFDGSTSDFEMLKRPDSVSIFCIVEEDLLILEDKQPHAGVKTTTPQGRVDPGDKSILAAAQRELLEETGYEMTHWRLIDVVQPVIKIEWFVNVFVAWGVYKISKPQNDPGEKIRVKRVPYTKAKNIKVDGLLQRGGFWEVVEACPNVDDLKQLPEFTGQTVDR